MPIFSLTQDKLSSLLDITFFLQTKVSSPGLSFIFRTATPNRRHVFLSTNPNQNQNNKGDSDSNVYKQYLSEAWHRCVFYSLKVRNVRKLSQKSMQEFKIQDLERKMTTMKIALRLLLSIICSLLIIHVLAREKRIADPLYLFELDISQVKHC